MVKRQKQKQKQKQSQNVIVNVNAPKRRSPRKGGRKGGAPPPPYPNFPTGPRSDPFIPREYKQPSLTDIITAIQTVKQPSSQSIEKETEKELPFAPRTISSVLSKATSGGSSDLAFIGQDPTIIKDVAKTIGPSLTGALGGSYVGFGLGGPLGAVAGSVVGALGGTFFGSEPNPKALVPVVPPINAPSATLERTRPAENPFSFVDPSPTLSTAPLKPTAEQVREKRLKKFEPLPQETQTFIPFPWENPFKNPFKSAPLVPDIGLVPETQTFVPFFPTALLQPINFGEDVPDEDPEIEFVDAEGYYDFPEVPGVFQSATQTEPTIPSFAYAYTSSESERDDERFKSSRKQPPRSTYVPVPTEPSIFPLSIETESALPVEQSDVTKRPAPPLPPPPKQFAFPPPPPTVPLFGTELPEPIQTESALPDEQPVFTENEVAKRLFKDTVRQKRAIKEAQTFVPPPLPETQSEFPLPAENRDVIVEPLPLTAPQSTPNFFGSPATVPSQAEFIEEDAPTPPQFERLADPIITEQLVKDKPKPRSPPRTEGGGEGGPSFIDPSYFTPTRAESKVDFTQFAPNSYERKAEKKRKEGEEGYAGLTDQEILVKAEELRNAGKVKSRENVSIKREDTKLQREEAEQARLRLLGRTSAVLGPSFTPEQLGGGKPR